MHFVHIAALGKSKKEFNSKSENDLYMLDEWLEDEEVSIVPEVFKRQIADA